MREVRITDAELQALIAPALRAHLKSKGFHTGASNVDGCQVFLPVNLDMAGSIDVERTEDGVWSFKQELNYALAERTVSTAVSHVEACRANAALIGEA